LPHTLAEKRQGYGGIEHTLLCEEGGLVPSARERLGA
jgi:hypothetical protein